MSNVKEIIKGMLKENTGRHMLDSGGAYGRNWEKNQDKDLDNDPEIRLEVWEDQVIMNLSTYHFLVNMLDIDAESKRLSGMFTEFVNRDENKGEAWFTCMEDFAEYLKEVGEISKCSTTNTYNFDNLLDQVIQFVVLDEDYIILQIHGGCDVRGGYTEPKIFKIIDFDHFFMGMMEITCFCECGKCNMDSYDSGHYWHTHEGNGIDPLEFWDLDKENNKIRYKSCGKDVEFYGRLQW